MKASCSKNSEHVVSNSLNRFCTECGAPLIKVTCPKGHEAQDANSKFCWQCGEKLSDVAVALLAVKG